METTETNEPHIPSVPIGILLLEDAQYYLYESGKWARFLGIMGFIGAGFLLLFGVFFGSAFSLLSHFRPMPYHYGPTPYPMIRPYPMMRFPMFFSGFMGFIYAGIAILCFFISLNLYQFGSTIKHAIEYKNSAQVSIALGKLNTFLKIKGVVVICVLALYALIIIGVIIATIMLRS
ncbi:DUF5362 family protein [Mucilaginibacter sp.]|uniref:DUF5362 family protein n=1 Tax=Mucilaginibacter sp. TaxID=1882438 RepID=UPI00260A1BBD|nr:DUF5362 family protein [Mucilaginibacter sp.]MDB4925297.1 hypothetical protein [Mucilaginibacter sp.]